MANGTLKVSNIQTSSGSGTITLGQSGETISVPSGATINLSDATQTGVGDCVLISTTTMSGTATSVNITSGIDSTYKEYIIKFTDVHLGSSDKRFTLQGSTNAGSSYGVTATTTAFRANHSEDDSGAALGYTASHDVAQSTSFFQISDILASGNNADECIAGFFQLFDPSNTTFVKHFIAQFNGNNPSESVHGFGAGYFNTTSAINAIQFKADSGNIDAGTFKLYGVV